jgi:zinc-finger of acetyl-transferase ESCO
MSGTMSGSHNPRHYAKSWPRWAGDFADACPVCGLTYVRELEGDRRIHRSRHREVLAVYEPKSLPALATLYAQHGEFVPLDGSSPRTLRRRLEGAARMFQREKSYDFPPYGADEEPEAERPPYHWLIASPDGRPFGGLSARWRSYSNAPARWVWAWVWVIPSERRKSWIQRCWAMLKADVVLQGIEPEPPFSYPIAKFFQQRGDVSERIRGIAAQRVQRGNHNEGDWK